MNRYFVFLPSVILTLAILAGQLIKLPMFDLAGPTLIDVSICLLAFIALITKYKSEIKLEKFYFFGILFALFGILSLFFSPLNLNLYRQANSLVYPLRFILYLLFGLMISSGYLKSIKDNTYLILYLSGLGLSILGILQLIFYPDLLFLAEFGWDPHYFRVVSTLLDPNFVGTFFTLTLLLIVILKNNLKSLFSEKFLSISLAIIFLSLVLTFSRGAYLMFMVSFISLSYLLKSINLFKTTVVAAIILLISFYFYTLLISEPRKIDRGESASFRINSWNQGISVFKKSPFIGVGFNSYRFALENYELANEKQLSSRGSTSNDSSLLFILSTTGLVGLLIYFLFIFFLIRQTFVAKTKKNPYANLLLAGGAGLFIQSFVVNNLFYPWILLWVFLVSAQLNNKPTPNGIDS